MTEFKMPVAMKVTKEQYKKDLEEPLLNLGYRMANSMSYAEVAPYLITQFADINVEIGFNQAPGYVKGEKRFIISEYNPELFLAVAAITHGDQFIIGEWILDTYIEEKLFQVKEYGEYNDIYAGKINNSYFPPTFKKPWLHQLVKYFDNSSQPRKYKLPERWYLKINKENLDLVNSWRITLGFFHLPKSYTWCITEEGIAYPEKKEDNREEITTEIFKKYIFNYESKLQIKTNKNEQQDNNNNEEQTNANLDSNSRSKGGKEIRNRIKSSRVICERRSIRRREKSIRARS